MKLFYIIHIDGKEYRGTVENAKSETKGTLYCSEYEILIDEGISAALCEEKEERLQASKCWIARVLHGNGLGLFRMISRFRSNLESER